LFSRKCWRLLSLAQSLCGASGPRRFNLRSIPDGDEI
jgi:hypothetical protein